MRVELTHDELRRYAALGCERAISAMSKGRKGAHGFNRYDERWQIDVEGLLAEFAAAKGLGLLPFEPVVGALDTKHGDIGPGLQVRGTHYDTGRLLLHDKDDDDHRFILVTGHSGFYVLRGWIYARHGKHPSYWKLYKGRGAYWVDQSRLQPMSKLELA